MHGMYRTLGADIEVQRTIKKVRDCGLSFVFSEGVLVQPLPMWRIKESLMGFTEEKCKCSGPSKSGRW